MPYLSPIPEKVAKSSFSDLGQFAYPNKARVYLKLTITDTVGTPIPSAKFYFDIEPDPALEPGIVDDPGWSAHYSDTTDDKGQVELDTWSMDGQNIRRLVSVTPLFASPFAPVNRAIVWKSPMTFSPAHLSSVTIVNKAGGGLTSQAALPAPTPIPPAAPAQIPASPGGTPGQAPGKQLVIDGAPGSFPWGLLLVGGVVFMAGLWLIPMIFEDKK